MDGRGVPQTNGWCTLHTPDLLWYRAIGSIPFLIGRVLLCCFSESASNTNLFHSKQEEKSLLGAALPAEDPERERLEKAIEMQARAASVHPCCAAFFSNARVR